MSLKYVIALAAFLALASVARAGDFDMQVNVSKPAFDALRSRVIAQLDSDRSAAIAPKDKAAVIEALDRIGQHLAKSPKGDQDLVDIYNDQELINQVTTRARADSRVYCKRDKPTGSHVMRVTCMSLAKWTERQNDDQTAMRAIADNHRSRCPGCIFDSGADPLPAIGH